MPRAQNTSEEAKSSTCRSLALAGLEPFFLATFHLYTDHLLTASKLQQCTSHRTKTEEKARGFRRRSRFCLSEVVPYTSLKGQGAAHELTTERELCSTQLDVLFEELGRTSGETQRPFIVFQTFKNVAQLFRTLKVAFLISLI